MAEFDFDTLITKTRPHIFEMICLSLDYESWKNCMVVNKAWNGALTSKKFQEKAKSVFKEEILADEQKLVHASRKGKTEEVRKLLSIGMVDVNALDEEDGETSLHKAARFGHMAIARLLLERGADVDKSDLSGWTPLFVASTEGKRSICQLLLDAGAEPRRKNMFGRTALHYAASCGQIDVIKLLLERGADPNATCKYGETPLQYAARRGNHDPATRHALKSRRVKHF